jgi:GDP-L-fucose synthase
VEPINLGSGVKLSIARLVRTLAEVVGYRGRLRFDSSKPDGMPLKVLDSTVLRSLGWRPSTDFQTSLAETYAWFLQHECDSPSVMEDVEDALSAVPHAAADSAA